MLAMMFGQSFELRDLMIVGLLIVLEGALSVDNALVLGLLAKRLPPEMRKRALTYGLAGAFLFRFVAIATAAWLLNYPIVKLLGGAYLLYVSIKHFAFESNDHEKHTIQLGADGQPTFDDPVTGDLSPEVREAEIDKRSPIPNLAEPQITPTATTATTVMKTYARFWPTVFVIEMTDIAFAVDSIVAAMAFIPPKPADVTTNPKLWVVIVGGFFGVVLMRFAAMIFIKLLECFPRFEVAAYLLVTVIGLKLTVDYIGNTWLATAAHPHPVNFHDTHSPWFWGFWIVMILCFAYGFVRRKNHGHGLT